MNNRPDFDFCPDIRAELPHQAQAQFGAMQSYIEEIESRVREFELGEWWLKSRDPSPYTWILNTLHCSRKAAL
jgi:hypothetical protein